MQDNISSDHNTFVGFVLLADDTWEKKKLISDLAEQWNIRITEQEDTPDFLPFQVDDAVVAIVRFPCPVPNQEAEQNAASNYLWPEAVEVTSGHKAHLVVTVLAKEADRIERGKLFVQILSCCCRQENVVGIYTSGTVFQPRFYEACASMMYKGELPLLNWIWFGLCRWESGLCGYTYGMKAFGKEEIEVLDTTARPSELRDFLISITSYILENDVVLHDGETIGFSAEDKHSISYSKGVCLPFDTLKITL